MKPTYAFVIVLVALVLHSCSTVSVLPTPGVSPSPRPSMPPMNVEVEIDPALAPSESPGVKLVELGVLGPSVNIAFAQRTVDLMNDAQDCLKQGVESHTFKSLHTFDNQDPANAKEAWLKFSANAPYKLDLHWYYKGWPTKVIGYTYNTTDSTLKGPSETRIWSNTRFMGDERQYASHLTHELSHQKRAGGLVHYTVFTGSFPYDVGDIMAKCLEAGR